MTQPTTRITLIGRDCFILQLDSSYSESLKGQIVQVRPLTMSSILSNDAKRFLEGLENDWGLLSLDASAVTTNEPVLTISDLVNNYEELVKTAHSRIAPGNGDEHKCTRRRAEVFFQAHPSKGQDAAVTICMTLHADTASFEHIRDCSVNGEGCQKYSASTHGFFYDPTHILLESDGAFKLFMKVDPDAEVPVKNLRGEDIAEHENDFLELAVYEIGEVEVNDIWGKLN